jgi:hypothetical protein
MFSTTKALLDQAIQVNLLQTLEQRFLAFPQPPLSQPWSAVRERLLNQPHKLWSLQQLEASGGQPDLVAQDDATGALVFMDCTPESPAGRRNTCYDAAALASRKTFKPQASAQEQALAAGVSLLTADQYRFLQNQRGFFDTKTSSWLQTPPDIRARGGAIFGDCRFNTVFIYHNGAESYYAARGWRGVLHV